MAKTVLATLAAFALAALAGEARAGGACVYVTLEQGKKTVVCEEVGASSVCDRKGVDGGTYHADQECSDVDHAAAPGPAKPRFDEKPRARPPKSMRPARVERAKGAADH